MKGQSTRAAGVLTPGLDFAGLAAYRDYMVSSLDDSGRVARYEERGVTVVKEWGRIAQFPSFSEALGTALRELPEEAEEERNA